MGGLGKGVIVTGRFGIVGAKEGGLVMTGAVKVCSATGGGGAGLERLGMKGSGLRVGKAPKGERDSGAVVGKGFGGAIGVAITKGDGVVTGGGMMSAKGVTGWGVVTGMGVLTDVAVTVGSGAITAVEVTTVVEFMMGVAVTEDDEVVTVSGILSGAEVTGSRAITGVGAMMGVTVTTGPGMMLFKDATGSGDNTGDGGLTDVGVLRGGGTIRGIKRLFRDSTRVEALTGFEVMADFETSSDVGARTLGPIENPDFTFTRAFSPSSASRFVSSQS